MSLAEADGKPVVCLAPCFHSRYVADAPAIAHAGPKDDLEESGWKMVSGDVFRSPPHALLLCVQLGSGVQIITSGFITLFFAALGKHLSHEQAASTC